MKNSQAYYEWLKDGNVIHFADGYATQDALYNNRLKTVKHLFIYFLKHIIH